MQSSDAQHYFETDAAQLLRQRRSAKASNRYGNPVVLKSKLVAVLADPTAPSFVYVAEAAGTARRVNVDDGSVTAVFRGPTAPATCLALGGPGYRTLFVGSWDKIVWSFPVDSSSKSVTPSQKYVGHADFVKAIVCGRLGGQDVLISGGADKRILVWDVASGRRLHTLQDGGGGGGGAGLSGAAARHAGRTAMLAVQDLAIDPVATTADEIWLVSASSDPHIRRWRVRRDGWEQVAEEGGEEQDGADAERLQNAVAAAATTASRTLLAHETTVYKVVFDTGDDDDAEEVNLWTASGDGTARCLLRRHGFRQKKQASTANGGGGGRATTLQHGHHVRAVALTDAWVVTAGRDEDLQYWDRTGADEDEDEDEEDGKTVGAGARKERNSASTATITGHYDEVTDLAVLADGRHLCSVSLDGTVRTWPLARADVDALVRQQRADREKGDTGDAGGEEEGNLGSKDGEADAAGLLTAEEDAELAALMDED